MSDASSGGSAATPVGTLEGRSGFEVGPTGAIVGRTGFAVDWWVGADDRWHLPDREAGVRQSLVGTAPVVETRLRVPAGDAVHRAYGVLDQHGGEHVAIEVENASGTPFALALVVTAVDGSGVHTDLPGVCVVDDGGTSALRAGDRTLLLLPKRPARAAGSTGWALDRVRESVTSGGAVADLGDAADGPAGCGPTAVLLFPVTHRTMIRALLPLGAGRALDGFPPVPPAEQVAAGWERMEDRGTSVVVPDSGLSDGLRASRAHLLLRAGRPDDDAEVVAALDHEGFHDEAARVLRGLLHADVAWRKLDPRAAAGLVDAAARHWAVTRDRELADEMLALLAVWARRAEKAGAAAAGALDRFAGLLEGLDQPDAARSVRPSGFTRTDTSGGWPAVEERRRGASPTWRWDRPGDGEAFLRATRDALLTEDDGGLSVLPGGLGPFAGQAIELHGAPTAFGPFSFAVRWHGRRPALLWELAAHGPDVRPIIRAPGLDRAWTTSDPTGEQLLGIPAAMMGLRHPTPEGPSRDRRRHRRGHR